MEFYVRSAHSRAALTPQNMFYDSAQSAPAALRLEATSRVASSRCGCFAFTSHGRLMGGQVEFWRKTCLSRKTVQRYVELSGFSKFFGEKMKKTLIMQCRDDKMRCSDGLQVATVAEVAQNCGRLVRYRVIK